MKRGYENYDYQPQYTEYIDDMIEVYKLVHGINNIITEPIIYVWNNRYDLRFPLQALTTWNNLPEDVLRALLKPGQLNSGHQRTFGIIINLICNSECNVVLNWNILHHKFQYICSLQTLNTSSTTGNTVFDGEAEVGIVLKYCKCRLRIFTYPHPRFITAI